MKDNLFKRNMSLLLQPFVFVWVPVVPHGAKCTSNVCTDQELCWLYLTMGRRSGVPTAFDPEEDSVLSADYAGLEETVDAASRRIGRR